MMKAARNVWGGRSRGRPAYRWSGPSGAPFACRVALRRGGAGSVPAALAEGEVDGRATRGTRGITAGLFPFPTMRNVRWPLSKPRSSASVAQASLTRSPFGPSKAARAAWSGS
jgi:hypothetical protein